jgi:hypothetical protein
MKTQKTQKTNDARRLLEFLNRANSLPGNASATDGWLNAAALPSAGLTDDEKITMAYEIVANFRRLLDRIELKYSEVASSDGYKSIVAHYRGIANAQYVHGQWAPVQQHFSTGQSRIVIETIADALPTDTDASGFESAKQLLDEVDALLAQISGSDLPTYHKHYAEMMLTKLRSSLRDYIMLGPQSAHEYSLFLHGLDAELAHRQPDLSKENAEISADGQSLIDKVLEKTKKATELCKSGYYVGSALILAYQGTEKSLRLLRRAAENLLQ